MKYCDISEFHNFYQNCLLSEVNYLSTVLIHYQSQFNDCERLGKNVLLFTDVPKTKHEAFNLVDEIVNYYMRFLHCVQLSKIETRLYSIKIGSIQTIHHIKS